MESKIPIPTDNIYKFFAVFGLMLFITSIVTFVYLHQTTNSFLFGAFIEVEELSSIENPSPMQVKKREFLQKRIDIAVTDQKLFNNVLSWVVGARLKVTSCAR